MSQEKKRKCEHYRKGNYQKGLRIVFAGHSQAPVECPFCPKEPSPKVWECCGEEKVPVHETFLGSGVMVGGVHFCGGKESSPKCDSRPNCGEDLCDECNPKSPESFREVANRLAKEANECCNRSDGWEEDLFIKIEEALIRAFQKGVEHGKKG